MEKAAPSVQDSSPTKVIVGAALGFGMLLTAAAVARIRNGQLATYALLGLAASVPILGLAVQKRVSGEEEKAAAASRRTFSRSREPVLSAPSEQQSAVEEPTDASSSASTTPKSENWSQKALRYHKDEQKRGLSTRFLYGCRSGHEPKFGLQLLPHLRKEERQVALHGLLARASGEGEDAQKTAAELQSFFQQTGNQHLLALATTAPADHFTTVFEGDADALVGFANAQSGSFGFSVENLLDKLPTSKLSELANPSAKAYLVKKRVGTDLPLTTETAQIVAGLARWDCQRAAKAALKRNEGAAFVALVFKHVKVSELRRWLNDAELGSLAFAEYADRTEKGSVKWPEVDRATQFRMIQQKPATVARHIALSRAVGMAMQQDAGPMRAGLVQVLRTQVESQEGLSSCFNANNGDELLEQIYKAHKLLGYFQQQWMFRYKPKDASIQPQDIKRALALLDFLGKGAPRMVKPYQQKSAIHKYMAKALLREGSLAALYSTDPLPLKWSDPSGPQGLRLAMQLTCLLDTESSCKAKERKALKEACCKLLKSGDLTKEQIRAIALAVLTKSDGFPWPWTGNGQDFRPEAVLLLEDALQDRTFVPALLDHGFSPAKLLCAFNYGIENEDTDVCQAILKRNLDAANLIEIVSDNALWHKTPAKAKRDLIERLACRCGQRPQGKLEFYPGADLTHDIDRVPIEIWQHLFDVGDLSLKQLAKTRLVHSYLNRLVCTSRPFQAHLVDAFFAKPYEATSDSEKKKGILRAAALTLSPYQLSRLSKLPGMPEWMGRLAKRLEAQKAPMPKEEIAKIRVYRQEPKLLMQDLQKELASAYHEAIGCQTRGCRIRILTALALQEKQLQPLAAHVNRAWGKRKGDFDFKLEARIDHLVHGVHEALTEAAFDAFVVQLDAKLLAGVAHRCKGQESGQAILRAVAAGCSSKDPKVKARMIPLALELFALHADSMQREDRVIYTADFPKQYAGAGTALAEYMNERRDVETATLFCRAVRHMPASMVRAIPISTWQHVLKVLHETDNKHPPKVYLQTVPWVASRLEGKEEIKQLGTLFAKAIHELSGSMRELEDLLHVSWPTDTLSWHVGCALGDSTSAAAFVAGVKEGQKKGKKELPLSIVQQALTIDDKLAMAHKYQYLRGIGLSNAWRHVGSTEKLEEALNPPKRKKKETSA